MTFDHRTWAVEYSRKGRALEGAAGADHAVLVQYGADSRGRSVKYTLGEFRLPRQRQALDQYLRALERAFAAGERARSAAFRDLLEDEGIAP